MNEVRVDDRHLYLDRYLIPMLNDKIILLLLAGKGIEKNVKSIDGLADYLGLKSEALKRIRHGYQPITDDQLTSICDLFGISKRDMIISDIYAFGKMLKLTRSNISAALNRPIPGIDFESRTRDFYKNNAIFETLEGWYQALYYWYEIPYNSKKSGAASITSSASQVNSLLLHFYRIDSDGFIHVRAFDRTNSENDYYEGFCFHIGGFLYITLENSYYRPELVQITCTRPDRPPNRMFGIMTAPTSGAKTPAPVIGATKVYIRSLGQKLREVYDWTGLPVPDDLDESKPPLEIMKRLLCEKNIDLIRQGKVKEWPNRKYVDWQMKEEGEEIFEAIDNTISREEKQFFLINDRTAITYRD